MRFTIPLLVALTLAADASAGQYTITTLAGSDASGDGNAGAYVLLLQPQAVAFDGNGNLYIADAADHRVRMMNTEGIVTTVAGTGRPGFSGDGGVATAAQLDRPYGVAADSAGDIYIADLGNARVRRVDAQGVITTVAGGGSTKPNNSGAGIAALDAQLASPRNVVAATDGSVYFSDFDGQSVFRIDSSGMLTTVAGTGAPGFSGDGGKAVSAEIAYPAGLAVDASGALYIADSGNGRVRRIANGAITTVASVGGVVDVALDLSGHLYVAAPQMLGNPNSPIPGSALLDPRGLAINPAGNIVYSAGNLIEVTDLAGIHMAIVGLSGASAWGDGGPATAARFASPMGCALDGAGNLYIADTGENRVRELNAKGIVNTVYGTGDTAMLNGPRSVAVALDGSLLIADTGNGRVLKRDSSGNVSTLLDQLQAPSYLYPDPDGDLYIAETGANRITLLAADGSTRFLPVTQPVAVTRDSQGTLYVAQSGSGQLLRFDASGFGTTLATGLRQPMGLAIDPSGNILAADSLNNEVVSISATGTIATLAGTGTAGFAGDNGPALTALLSGPTDVKLDARGNLYVMDAGNNRVRLLTPATSKPQISGLQVVSSASFIAGAISPNEIVSLFGTFDPSSLQVQIGGQPATLFYVGTTQINALVPNTLSVGSSVSVAILQNGAATQNVVVNTASAAPALYTATEAGTGQAAALNQDGSVNSAASPCASGDVIQLLGTGFGLGTVAVTIGGQTATVQSAGEAPGSPGLMEISASVPAGLTPGNAAVQVSIGPMSSQGGVTIAVK